MLKPYSKAEVSFDLRQEIGQEGANSNTYVAHDDQLDAEIVIKKIPKNCLDSVTTFFDESRILYLSSHPNVVQIYYACQDADNIFIAMPYYRRGSLNALINSRYLTVREIVVLGCQIASGLHNIHSKRLVHFDIKPDNILLSDRGEALISDFGLSRRLTSAGTAGQDRMYFKMRPPEAYGTSDFTRAFDIYQLGLTLYRMCNGNAVFEEQFARFGTNPSTFDRDGFRFDVRNARFPDRDSFEDHIPDRLRRLVRKCLAPAPTDRFQAAIDVSNELAQVEDRLDWQFEKQGATRIWTRVDGSKHYQLTVDGSNTSRAEKTTESGRTSRITDYCKTGITSREIRRFLGET
ncbi:serine/threonine-protein kinase [Burkholderia pyrrocinia]|uniref:serine/threonine-protein kinase n=1 Tax=Burkholderia pyrrocinia TaxID=60550 RepID=UPI00158B087C|nr:serine/threonine-protein kinase [Burkholderia pyrrocinia]